MSNDAALGAAASIRHQCPVIKKPCPEYRKPATHQGSCSKLWISADKKTVLKSPQAWHVDGCTEEEKIKYKGFEKESAELLDREKEIYHHLGKYEGLLPYLQITDLGIEFPYMEKGNLHQFLLNSDDATRCFMRLAWIKSALKVFAFIHGKRVLQVDVNAYNLLVADDLSLLLCDFSGSKIGDKENLVRPETRYEKFPITGQAEISLATEIFAIGSLIYEISTGKRPYDEMDDDEVESLFRQGVFPETANVRFGSIVEKCWRGEFESAEEILEAVHVAEKTEV